MNVKFFFALFAPCGNYYVRRDFSVVGLDRCRGNAHLPIAKTKDDGGGYARRRACSGRQHHNSGDNSKKELNRVTDLAQKVLDAAQQGIRTVSDMSDDISPFFKSWPDQLKHNELKLYRCIKHEHYWLQPQNLPTICPYSPTELLYSPLAIEEVGK